MELPTFTKVRRLVHGWKTKLGFDVDLASVHFPQHPTHTSPIFSLVWINARIDRALVDLVMTLPSHQDDIKCSQVSFGQ